MRYISFILLHTCETKAYKIYANLYQNGRRKGLDHWVSHDPIFLQIFTKSCLEKVYTVELTEGSDRRPLWSGPVHPSDTGYIPYNILRTLCILTL
jgi:hypothetical protein